MFYCINKGLQSKKYFFSMSLKIIIYHKFLQSQCICCLWVQIRGFTGVRKEVDGLWQTILGVMKNDLTLIESQYVRIYCIKDLITRVSYSKYNVKYDVI